MRAPQSTNEHVYIEWCSNPSHGGTVHNCNVYSVSVPGSSFSRSLFRFPHTLLLVCVSNFPCAEIYTRRPNIVPSFTHSFTHSTNIFLLYLFMLVVCLISLLFLPLSLYSAANLHTREPHTRFTFLSLLDKVTTLSMPCNGHRLYYPEGNFVAFRLSWPLHDRKTNVASLNSIEINAFYSEAVHMPA